MYIPERKTVEAAFALSLSGPALLAEMEWRYDTWPALRGLIRGWRKLAPKFENGMLLEMCAMELENLLDIQREGDNGCSNREVSDQ